MDNVLHVEPITWREMASATFDEKKAAAQRHQLEVKKLKVQIVAAFVSIAATVTVAAVKIHSETKTDEN